MQPADNLDSRTLTLSIYARVWAFAVLFSQLSSFHWVEQLPAIDGTLDLITLGAAAWVAFFRFSLHGWLLALLTETLNLAVRLPEIPNHCHVILFINFLILSAFLRGRNNHEQVVNAFWSITIPFLQATTFCVYLFAFFAKLNWTYADPEYSCSIKFLHNINAFVGFLPINRFTSLMVIHGSLVLEGLLPLLLWRRGTRMFGVALGLLFHYGLAFDLIKYFTNFSGVMFALLLAFCPPTFFLFLNRYWLPGSASAGPEHRSPLLSLRGALGLFSLIAIIATGAYAVLAPTEVGARVWRLCQLLRHLGWAAYSSLVLLAFARFWRTGKTAILRDITPLVSASDRNEARAHRWLEIGILALVIVNGTAPYLGLKTRTSFNMYSNLRIEPETSNHYVFTASLNLLGFLSHPARIEPSVEAGIEHSPMRHSVCQSGLWFGSWYPLVEIARRVRECPKERFGFFYERTYYEAHSIEAQTLLDSHSSWWSRRFSIFRPMDERAAVDCIW